MTTLQERYKKTALRGLWEPPAGCHTHAGKHLREDAVFPDVPPPEIGAVLSASTTVSRRSWRPGFLTRLLLGVIAGSALATLVWLYADSMEDDRDLIRVQIRLFGMFFGFVLAALVTVFLDREDTCTFVGTDGFVETRFKGSLMTPRRRVIRFDRVAGVRTRFEKRAMGAGTAYDYEWVGLDGGPLFLMHGTYRLAAFSGELQFASAAERAWGEWFSSRWETLLEKFGAIHFDSAPGEWIRIKRGSLEYQLRPDQPSKRLNRAELKEVSLQEGWFRFKRSDAGPVIGSFEIELNYGELLNARAFALALDRYLGFAFAPAVLDKGRVSLMPL